MNIASPFSPSVVLQPIRIKTTEIKMVNNNILLIIFKLLFKDYLFAKSDGSVDFKNR
jgi:hypothetical protein